MPVFHAVPCEKKNKKFYLCTSFSEMTKILKLKNILIISWASLGGVKAPCNLDVLRVYS